MIRSDEVGLIAVCRKSSASDGELQMSKRAIAVVEEQDMKTSTLATEEEMAKRKILADHIRDRMAKPATDVEQRLWQELKAEVEKDRDHRR
jgi:hypothetical protein